MLSSEYDMSNTRLYSTTFTLIVSPNSNRKRYGLSETSGLDRGGQLTNLLVQPPNNTCRLAGTDQIQEPKPQNANREGSTNRNKK